MKRVAAHAVADDLGQDWCASALREFQLLQNNDPGAFANHETVADHPVTGIKEELGQIDFILEGTGNSEVAFAAMAQLGINGVLCLTGVSAGNRQIEIPSDVINLQMVLGNRLAFGSVNANRRYFEMGVQHFQQAERQWPGIFERLITRRVPLDDFTAALDRRPEDIKTLLTIAPA